MGKLGSLQWSSLNSEGYSWTPASMLSTTTMSWGERTELKPCRPIVNSDTCWIQTPNGYPGDRTAGLGILTELVLILGNNPCWHWFKSLNYNLNFLVNNSFCSWGNRRSERISNLPRDTQLGKWGVKVVTQACLTSTWALTMLFSPDLGTLSLSLEWGLGVLVLRRAFVRVDCLLPTCPCPFPACDCHSLRERLKGAAHFLHQILHWIFSLLGTENFSSSQNIILLDKLPQMTEKKAKVENL